MSKKEIIDLIQNVSAETNNEVKIIGTSKNLNDAGINFDKDTMMWNGIKIEVIDWIDWDDGKVYIIPCDKKLKISFE